jgi:hypothetical protein
LLLFSRLARLFFGRAIAIDGWLLRGGALITKLWFRHGNFLPHCEVSPTWTAPAGVARDAVAARFQRGAGVTTMDDRDNRIREFAYFFWQEEGRPEGQADRHWREAEEMIEQEEGAEALRKIVEGGPPGDTPLEEASTKATPSRRAS